MSATILVIASEYSPNSFGSSLGTHWFFTVNLNGDIISMEDNEQIDVDSNKLENKFLTITPLEGPNLKVNHKLFVNKIFMYENGILKNVDKKDVDNLLNL